MASIRQGYLDDYSQQNQNVGIGTSIPKEKLEIHGGVTSKDLSVTGIATITSASGFIRTNLEYVENVNLDAGDSGTLSDEIIVGAGLTMTVGTAATAGQGNIDSLKVYSMFQPPTGGTNQRPVGKPGSLFYNTDFKTIEFFDGNSWRQVDNTTRSGRAVIAQGYQPSYYPQMYDFLQITTLGNTEYFGDITEAVRDKLACGSETRGLFGGGITPGGSRVDNMESITIPSQGSGISFGDLTQGIGHGAACSSSTRGIFAGGYQPALNNTIQFVQIQTAGDGLDFGDLSLATGYGGAGSSATRAVFCGGSYNAPNDLASDRTEFVTIASKGNGTDFGGMTNGRFRPTSCGANSLVFTFGSNAGNSGQIKGIDRTDTNSLGRSINFGDLAYDLAMGFAAGNNTRVVVGAGQGGGTSPAFQQNNIQFITIASSGNSVDFGEVTLPTVFPNATSDSHGGLGGF